MSHNNPQFNGKATKSSFLAQTEWAKDGITEPNDTVVSVNSGFFRNANAEPLASNHLMNEVDDSILAPEYYDWHQFRAEMKTETAEQMQNYNLDVVDKSIILAPKPNNPNNIHIALEQNLVPTADDSQHQIVWNLMSGTTVGRALASATQRLRSLEILTPELDAQVILARSLGQDRSWLFAHHDEVIDDESLERFVDLIARRTGYEPVAYLVGCKEFYGLAFAVDQRVLIPRPETELLVDIVLDHIDVRSDNLPLGHRLTIADIGTGSGAIAIAVAVNAPDVDVYATDVSSDALEIARLNIKGLDKRCQVSLLQGDLLEPLANKVDLQRVDIIVANLPYITLGDYEELQRDVRDYEPQLALTAGPEGLDTIEHLLKQAPNYIKPSGVILLEIGSDQGEAVVMLAQKLIPQASSIRLRQDYNGRDRIVMIAM